MAIETLATVQAIYGLAGRQTQGFLQSVFELMKITLTVPDHSALSRRRQKLTISLPVKDWSKLRHLVVDSTGVKVYGETAQRRENLATRKHKNRTPRA